MPGKILLCDDDPGIVESVQLVLELKGYEVLGLMDGEAVQASLEVFTPDVILLDLWLSGISGEEITRELKSHPDSRNIPVVILSANQQTAEIAERIGADASLSKPFDITELEAVIRPFLPTA